jgi:hypothetical protein
LGCWARRGAKSRVEAVTVRSPPVWARRRRRSEGVVSLPGAVARERACDGMRGIVRAQGKSRLGWVSAALGAARRETRRSPARRHGQRRARLPRSARARARGFTAVAGHVQGDQGRGVLLPPLHAMMHKVPGHGEATAAQFDQPRWRRPTRGGRAKAQPGLPAVDTRACWGVQARALG